jgi:hypothetical protein
MVLSSGRRPTWNLVIPDSSNSPDDFAWEKFHSFVALNGLLTQNSNGDYTFVPRAPMFERLIILSVEVEKITVSSEKAFDIHSTKCWKKEGANRVVLNAEA